MSDVTATFYAAEGAQTGYGWQWLIGDGASPETFQAVKAVVSITPGDMNTADILRTHLRSPDAHQEHMPGMRDSGPFTMELIWLPEDESQSNAGGGSVAFTEGGIIALWRSREIRNHKLMANDASPAMEWPFRGYISQFQPGVIGNDDKIGATVAVQPTEAYDADLP